MNIYSTNILKLGASRVSWNGSSNRIQITFVQCYSEFSPTPIKPTMLTPLQEYDTQIKLGRLRDDPFQRSVLSSLGKFHEALTSYYAPVLEPIRKLKGPSWTSSLRSKFGFLGGSKDDLKQSEVSNVPQGLYLYGDVGCGKTMLMDLFYKTIPPHLTKKRIHFHQFMQDVHKRSHEILMDYHKKTGQDTKDIDVIPFLANEIAQNARILCFDEFQVTDVADAMILRRLFTVLLSNKFGVILFATSNRHPDELYINGVQRKSFIPCIELIKARTKVVNLNSTTDYRRIPRPVTSVYSFPQKGKWKYDSPEFKVMRQHHVESWYNYFSQQGDAVTSTVLPSAEASLLQTKHEIHHYYPLTIWGRQFIVPKCTPPRVAQFTFNELCGQPLAAGDYLMLAKNFKAFIVTDIPYLSIDIRDKIRRFITFLDAIYDNDCKLATTGADNFTSLFVESDMLVNDFELKPQTPKATEHADEQAHIESVVQNSTIFTLDEERFAFARALSRLSQMSTTDWVSK